jgi:small subunit ribosomal protein S21
MRVGLGYCCRALPTHEGNNFLQVMVRDNNVEQALRVLKKKLQREGLFREMKRRRFYEKPSERSAREHNDAMRRARKLARKKAQQEGLLPAPRNKKPLATKSAGRGAPFSSTGGPPRPNQGPSNP